MGPSSIFEYRLFDLKCPTMLVLLHSSGTSALSELPEITSSPFRVINITDLLSRSLCGHLYMYTQMVESKFRAGKRCAFHYLHLGEG